MIILTPTYEEKNVIEIADSRLKDKLANIFSDLTSFNIVNSPEFNKLYELINSPFEVLKSKNNSQILTSMMVSLKNINYECIMQKPLDVLKARKWHDRCEDNMELKIHNGDSSISVYAVKNNPDKQNKDDYTFSFFISMYDYFKLDIIISKIDDFLKENALIKSYVNIYNQLLRNYSFHDIKESIINCKYKETIINNEKFIFNFIYSGKNPSYMLENLLNNEMIKPVWKDGQQFFQHFTSLFSNSDNLIHIKDSYDKFMLYLKLNQTLVSNSQKNKFTKI